MSAGSKLESTKTRREEAHSHMSVVTGTIYCLLPLLLTDVWLFCLKSILGSEECFWEADEDFCPAGKWSKNFLGFFKTQKHEQYAPLYEGRVNRFSSIPSSPCNDTLPSQLVLFFFIAEVVDQSGDAIFQPAVPVGPRLRTQGFIPELISCTVSERGGGTLKGKQKCQSPLQKGLEAASIGKTSSPDPQVFHQAQILHLMSDQDFIKLAYTKDAFFIRPNSITRHLAVLVTHDTGPYNQVQS